MPCAGLAVQVHCTDALVSEPQAQRIADLYEGAGEMAERGRLRSVFILLAAAATLVGLAALLLIVYNWDQLSRWSKLAIVLGVVDVTHAAGFAGPADVSVGPPDLCARRRLERS